ncbi:glycosyltransferase family 2 protein [Rhodopirellula sp. MGV]|uniref:glycosyltransferase family 2 protein n=1 Tax=Rhodopirellula sp. MGV TaxID=2023130 RepID=UPI000B96FD67|nr:glycosyltransferase family 2 protein [Rhodopirellula sp. MGV]OYP37474.1 hypothetical protein CGZ80_04920 [Rhodopirellula sp. MGV]PNY37876.1 glycosyltransferase [Rhodopirellula baltica]
MVKVSYIIPTLNQAGFLQRCLDSCFGQQIDDCEILVQDGGSTDGTLDILHRNRDRIDAVSKPDKGQSDAINQCIDRAKGEIIAWINSDDYYPNHDVLRTICETFDSAPELDIVYGDGMYVDEHGNPLRRFASFPIDNPRRTLINHPTSPCAQPALFFKRELYQRVGGLRQDLHWAMDHELWFRMFLAAKGWQYIPQEFAHLTLHADAKSVRAIGKQMREVAEIKRQFLHANRGGWNEHLQVVRGTMMVRLYRVAYSTGLLDHYWRLLRR